MREIEAIRASESECSPYGTFTRLTDNECFAGDGWECWMTEQLCMDQPAQVSVCHSDSVQPYTVSAMMQCGDSQKLVICGCESMIIALAEDRECGRPLAEEIRAFILEPGEILRLRPGIWHDIGRGTHKPVDYYTLSLEENAFTEPEGESVRVVLKGSECK